METTNEQVVQTKKKAPKTEHIVDLNDDTLSVLSEKVVKIMGPAIDQRTGAMEEAIRSLGEVVGKMAEGDKNASAEVSDALNKLTSQVGEIDKKTWRPSEPLTVFDTVLQCGLKATTEAGKDRQGFQEARKALVDGVSDLNRASLDIGPRIVRHGLETPVLGTALTVGGGVGASYGLYKIGEKLYQWIWR